MPDAPIQLGDHVITLQMPGIFVVTGRTGRNIDITSEDGVTMTVSDASVRRMDIDVPPESEHAPDDE